MSKSSRLMVRLTPELLKAFKLKAVQEGNSMAELIIKMIEDYLQEVK